MRRAPRSLARKRTAATHRSTTNLRRGALACVASATAALAMFATASPASAAPTDVGLGTAKSFAILAGSGATNTGPSVINGDVGTSPTPALTGFTGAPLATVNGSIHAADAAAGSAQAALGTAYDNAAGQGPTTTIATELGGQTLTPGVYSSASGTFGITGPLTLNAQGDPGAVFIFKTNATLVTAVGSSVNMVNGAQSCHVFWKVGSSATLGASSLFSGTVMAAQAISLNNAVTVDGRLLARNAAVTLINDTVGPSACATPPGGGNPGGGGGSGGGNGGNPGGDGNGGGGNGGGGNPGGGGNGGGGGNTITNVVGNGNGKSACADKGFRAKFNIRSRGEIRSAKVYVDGQLIARSTSKRFSAWVSLRGLRAGGNTIRLVVVDGNGGRDISSERFRRCEKAVPEPSFTGRVALGL